MIPSPLIYTHVKKGTIQTSDSLYFPYVGL